MTDIFGVDASLGQKRPFKGKDNQREVDKLPKLIHTVSAPGPYLRRDIVDYGNAKRFYLTGETQVETGVVDQNDGTRTVLLYFLQASLEQAAEKSITFGHFPETQDRQVFGIGELPLTDLGQPRATQTKKSKGRIKFLKSRG